MNKIGFAYIIVGVGVIIASYAIDPVKLSLFIIVGGVFALIGIVNLLKRSTSKTWGRVEKAEKTRHAEHRTTAHHEAHHPSHIKKHCSHCGKELKHEDFFCPECGGRHMHYRAK